MAAITLRSALTRGLNSDEVDANFTALNNELATKVNQAGARSSISVSGSLSYNATTGVISYTTPVTSVAGKTGAITLTKSDVGLSVVENKTSATIRSEITSGNVTGALGFTPPASNGTGASGTWAISISGNAGSATSAGKWTTARTLSLTGDVSGSASIDGSGNVSLTATVGDNSHTHDNTTISTYKGRNAVNIDTYDQNSTWSASIDTSTSYGTKPTSYVNIHNLPGNGVSEGTQIATYYGGNNNAWIRSRSDGTNAWLGWTQILTSESYTSYVGNGAMTVTAGSGLTGGGQLGTANQSGASSITISHADTSSQASVNNSGATVIQDVTLDGYGHVTGLASKTMGYADVGAPSTTGANASGTWGISITGSANTLDGIDSSGFVQTTNNSSLNSDTRNTRGVTRLYRRDDNSDYSVQHYWTGSHWYLQGFYGDTFHAHCRVGYADSAGSAPASDVYSWAKASTKPSYTYSEVGAAASSHSHSYLPLSGGTLTGDIIFGSSDRDNSPMGTYDSYKTQQIWAMGAAYRNSSTGDNFGNLYGASYKHTNNGTGGTMAGGHQFVWCQNGSGTAALGDGVWTSGNVTAYSDELLKTDWATLPTDYVEQLAQVLSGTYTRIDTGIRQIGVGARSLKGVAPDGVVDGEYLSVAYGNVALASAVELAKRVVKLGAQIDHLTSIVENLTKA